MNGPATNEALMSLPRTVAAVLKNHLTLEVESLDRMYLNVYVPPLQTDCGVACFWRFHRGHRFASSVLMDPMSKGFLAKLEAYARNHNVPILTFAKGQRKDDVAKEHLAKFRPPEGVVFIGKAQERARVFRTERRQSQRGGTYPWIVASTAMVNRRLLDVQKITQDCALGEAAFRQVTQPVLVQEQRAAALRYADPRVQAVLSALLGFSLLVRGFTNRQLRERVAGLLGQSPESLTAGRMSYDLRRLRLHGLITRVKKSNRYYLTQRGIQIAMFFTRSYARILRPGLAQITGPEWENCSALRRSFDQVLRHIDQMVADAKLAA